MEDKRSLITMGLKPLLLEEAPSAGLKLSICQLCVALADHGFVGSDGGGEHVISFLMRHLVNSGGGGAVDTSAAAAITSDGGVADVPQTSSQCAQALLTIAKTCDSANSLLTTSLLEHVCLETYTPALADISRALRFVHRRRENEEQWQDETNGLCASLYNLRGYASVYIL